MKLFNKGISVIACLVIMGCHKDKNNDTMKQLTIADAGSTASVTMGETISLTLGNPSDGGYHFNDPEYKTSVLTLVSHTHQNGSDKAGDFGNDTWNFTAKASGTTTLEVTASRSTQNAQKVSLFANEITVK